MDEPIINITTTETRKFFKNQVTPKEFVQYLLYLQEEDKLVTNVTSTNDSDIPDCITATFYYPSDVDYYYDKLVLKAYLTNGIELSKRGMPRATINYYNIHNAADDYIGWSTTPGEREFYEDVFNLYPHQDIMYRADLKNHWKKVQYPFKFKMWSKTDYDGSKLYGKPRLLGTPELQDYILAQDRHFNYIDCSGYSELSYRKVPGAGFIAGDCLLIDKLEDNKIKLSMMYRKPTEENVNYPNDKGIVLDVDKMMSHKPENEKPVPKTTLDGAYSEGDFILAKGSLETYSLDWFYIDSINPEEGTAEFIKMEKDEYDSGKPSSIYRVYAEPVWRYSGNRIPKLTNEKFTAEYNRYGSNKQIHWYAPELDKYDFSIQKWTGGDVLIAVVDHSG